MSKHSSDQFEKTKTPLPQPAAHIGHTPSQTPVDSHAAHRMRFAPIAAPDLSGDYAKKNAGRLLNLVQYPKYQHVQSLWLEQVTQKLQGLSVVTLGRRLGLGEWHKKYQNEAALVTALESELSPLLSQALFGVRLLPIEQTDQVHIFFQPLPVLDSLPGLHPDYVRDLDEAHYHWVFEQSLIKNVLYHFVQHKIHAFLRTMLFNQRQSGSAWLDPLLMHTIEINFCQYYVPYSEVAYFENQPIRALGRDMATRVRKLIYGTQ